MTWLDLRGSADYPFESLSIGQRIESNIPSDDRTVYPTVAMALSASQGGVSAGRRHQGLGIWIIEENMMYRFVGGTTNAHFVPDLATTAAIEKIINTIKEEHLETLIGTEFVETIIEQLFVTETVTETFVEKLFDPEYLETLIEKLFDSQSATDKLLEQLFDSKHLETLIEKMFESNGATEKFTEELFDADRLKDLVEKIFDTKSVSDVFIDKLFSVEHLHTLVENIFESNAVTESFVDKLFASSVFVEKMKDFWSKEDLRVLTPEQYDEIKHTIQDGAVVMFKDK